MTGLMYHLTSYIDTMSFSKLCYLDMTFYSDEILMDYALILLTAITTYMLNVYLFILLLFTVTCKPEICK